MMRIRILALLALTPLLGCKPTVPSPDSATDSVETTPPVQESASYLKDDPKVFGYLCRPVTAGNSPALLIVHDRMGLTDGIKDETFRLAREGYVALAVDLYRGQIPKDAKDAERWERELPKARALADIQAAIDYLIDNPHVRQSEDRKSKNLGILGIGMGGVYALDAALREPRLRAVALCYCPLPAEAKQLEPLQASVFYIYAGKDKSVPADTMARFTKAMDGAGKRIYGIRGYIDCPHGFLDPADWPTYGKPKREDVEEVWDLIARYFDREMS